LAATLFAASSLAPAARAQAIDWPTYGFDSLRWSNNTKETGISPASVGGLKQLWAFNAGAFDASLGTGLTPSGGAIGGQPIVAAGVRVGAATDDLVLVGDNNGVFFALDANSTKPGGSVVWYRTLGTKYVGDPVDRAYGIRGTAALDHEGAGTVYTASNEEVFALDLSTGTTLPGWPVASVPAGADDTDGEIHDALNLVGNSLYVGTSGVGMDHPPYYGRIVRISTKSKKIVSNWFPLSGSGQTPTESGGGIWGWGGVAVEKGDAAGGVYAGTGNAVGGPKQVVYAEQVINLTRDLSTLAGSASPTLNSVQDVDYGATPLVFTPRGCGQKLLVIKNKTGLVVVETVGADGSLAVAQTIQVSTQSSPGFKGTAAWDAADQLVLLTLATPGPAPYTPGLAAFQVTATCSLPWLTLAWQATQLPNGAPIMAAGGNISSPTVANGLVFFGAETASMAGNSAVYAALTKPNGKHPAGRIVWSSRVLPGTFDSALPTVVNGKVFFSTVSAQPTIYAFGLDDE